jgi:hypothetical protein
MRAASVTGTACSSLPTATSNAVMQSIAMRVIWTHWFGSYKGEWADGNKNGQGTYYSEKSVCW